MAGKEGIGAIRSFFYWVDIQFKLCYSKQKENNHANPSRTLDY